jgi:hypothetical protein
MEELRRELEAARETLRTIRAGRFDGPRHALGGAGRPDRPLAAGIAEGGVGYFRAVALDYDGTLADSVVAPTTLAALAEARAQGGRVIPVTGRRCLRR